MILLLDNYDSFVHNVARYIRLGGKTTHVVRSDQIDAPEIAAMAPEAILISPGPHGPEQAGCCWSVVRQLAGEIPILGICLGHQTIAAAYGGEVVVGQPVHAMTSRIHHDGTGVFNGLPQGFEVGRYHSLHVRESTLPPGLQVTARTIIDKENPDVVVMGVSDHARCVHGVQFHPESLLTEHGQAMLNQFFRLVDRHQQRLTMLDRMRTQSGRPVVWPHVPGQLRQPPPVGSMLVQSTFLPRLPVAEHGSIVS